MEENYPVLIVNDNPDVHEDFKLAIQSRSSQKLRVLSNAKTTIYLLLSACLMLISLAFAKGDLILVIRPEGDDFVDVIKGLTEGLGDEFNVHELVLNRNLSEHKVYERMSSTYPRLVILMDNKAISLFKKYQSSDMADTVNITPSISLMGVLVQDAIKNIKNGVGISYEIPLVTSASALRSGIKKPVKHIGVIHRNFMENFIESNREYCKAEDFEIVAESIPDNLINYKPDLKRCLRRLLKEKDVDALWLPNDNILLQSEIIRDVWIPALKRRRTPVITGVEILANPKLKFGTIAVLPDHIALGTQTAELVFEARSSGWKFPQTKTDPPLSVIKIINSSQAKKFYGADNRSLENFDKILK